MESVRDIGRLSFIILLWQEANLNISFGEIQTAPHFAQKGFNNDVIL